MAEIVLGLASSHTPQTSTSAEFWKEHAARDERGQLPTGILRSGTSEALNWITAGGALSGLSFELLDYIPAYRSPAGTGVGMAFATWNRDRAARTEQETAAS